MKDFDFKIIVYLIIFIIVALVKLFKWIFSLYNSKNIFSEQGNRAESDFAEGSSTMSGSGMGDSGDLFDINDYIFTNSVKKKKKKQFIRKDKAPSAVNNTQEPEVFLMPENNVNIQKSESASVQNSRPMSVPEKIMNDKITAMIAYEVLGPPKALRDD